MRRAACLVWLIVLVLPGVAQAWQPAPTTDEGRLAYFLPIARAAWPESPCTGREVIHLHADAALDELDARDGINAMMRARAATCEVWIQSDAIPDNPAGWCSGLVHEFGHMDGYGHTDDPAAIHAPPGPAADVMQASGSPWSACVTVLRPPARAQAEIYVRQELPADGRGWQITCTPMRAPHPRCRAERGAKVERFVIRIIAGEVISAE